MSGCLCDPFVGSFWADIDKIMRKVAPNTLIGGLDVNIGPTHVPAAGAANHFSTCNMTANSTRCQPQQDSDAGTQPYK
jgi:hypothetical protein